MNKLKTIMISIILISCVSFNLHSVQIPEGMPKINLEITKRVVNLKGVIDFKLADEICQKLLDYDSDNNEIIFMFIDTPGGYVDAGQKIIDVMRAISSRIHGVVVGYCMSMGMHILVECDIRSALTNTEYLIHDVGLNLFYIQVRQAALIVRQALQLNNELLLHLHVHLKMKFDDLTYLSAMEWDFRIDDAFKIGAINNVVIKLKSKEKDSLKNIFWKEKVPSSDVKSFLLRTLKDANHVFLN